jgi:16S rRNA (cytosine1402-N4)-methyltransferase
MMNKTKHVPVMLQEAIEYLNIKADHWYVDATFGQGGHTQEILSLGGKVIAFDYDEQNIIAGKEKFTTEIDNQSLILIRENFSQLEKTAKQLTEVNEIDGILFDFGTTSEQLTSADRGLSFSGQDQELDMRLDQRLGVKAKDLLAIMSQNQLQKIFEVFGGETEARKISKEIVELRKNGQFTSTVAELANLVSKIKHHSSRNIHPATKVFQALRIAVNNELESIEQALPQALEVIKSQGKIITIAFHEGEDRIIKNYFRKWEKENKGTQDSRRVLKPTEEEVLKNPKSRSAKLRGFTKK